jgi:hypothetical protein
MSRTFSTNCGSAESLNVSTRCDCSPKVCQMREMVAFDRARDLRHGARAPLRRDRRGFQRPGDDVDDLLVGHFPRRARPWFVGEPFEPARAKPLAPLTHAVTRHAQASRDRPVRQSLGTRQHDARSHGHTLRRGGPARPLIQGPPFVVRQQQRFTVALSRHVAQGTNAMTEVQDFF